MTPVHQQLAAAAQGLVGVLFRLHGRDRATGLDCVGLVACAFAGIGRPLAIPATYGLRNADIRQWLSLADRPDIDEVEGSFEVGDIALTLPGPSQHHIMIVTSTGTFVHAHAGLRRVVETPLPLPWPTLRHWRLKV